MFEAAGAVYNEETGFYELNGIDDLTWEDMMETFLCSIPLYNTNNWSLAFMFNKKIRTNLIDTRRFLVGSVGPEHKLGLNLGGFCYDCSSIEVVKFIDMCSPNGGFTQVFRGCVNLRTVIGDISIKSFETTGAFTQCYKLADIRLRVLRESVLFADSPLLSNASILYMIQHSEATKDISITLHPSAFARTVADAEIQAALAEKPLVSLVQAAT